MAKTIVKKTSHQSYVSSNRKIISTHHGIWLKGKEAATTTKIFIMTNLTFSIFYYMLRAAHKNMNA